MNLDGVRVLDLTRLLPGPYATQLLADLGADVVKVEPPEGDYARWLPPTTPDGVGAVFDAVNRGKRSVSLDLKTDAGREAFHRLAADADVVFEGFRPGVVDRLGIGHDDLRAANPDLVYCSLSGYGGTGPDADRAGHDLNYVGRAGLLDMTRRDDDEAPRIPGYPIGDMAGGLFAAFAIVSALLARGRGDGGAYLDVSMTGAVLSLSQAIAPAAFAGDDPRPGETPLTGQLPWYDVYEAADGRYVTLAALEPQFWAAFCEAVDREDLVEAHMTADPAEREALREELAAVFAERTAGEWEAELRDVDATVAAVNTPAEAVADPQVRARGQVVDSAEARPRVGLPFRTAGSDGATTGPDHATGPPPGFGADTEAVLREYGYDDDDIEDLRDAGAI